MLEAFAEGREGVLKTFEHVRHLKQHGVEFESYTEPQFRTTGMAGEQTAGYGPFYRPDKTK
ncbi:MAG: hypothetical protein M3Y27_00435 [Acidobacteriota bacterium]|nr:hypothetical protein [Acidobacteriota bacterium]